MNDDRELLESAARAAGIRARWIDGSFIRDEFAVADPRALWNPLTDDGDALRLAVKLHLDVMTSCRLDEIQVGGAVKSTTFQPIEGNRFAATRRAIVRAAAEIGMKTGAPQTAG